MKKYLLQFVNQYGVSFAAHSNELIYPEHANAEEAVLDYIKVCLDAGSVLMTLSIVED